MRASGVIALFSEMRKKLSIFRQSVLLQFEQKGNSRGVLARILQSRGGFFGRSNQQRKYWNAERWFIQQDKEIVTSRAIYVRLGARLFAGETYCNVRFRNAPDVSRIEPRDARGKMIDETPFVPVHRRHRRQRRRGSISVAARDVHNGVSSFVKFLWTSRGLFRARPEREGKRSARESRNQVPWNINAARALRFPKASVG